MAGLIGGSSYLKDYIELSKGGCKVEYRQNGRLYGRGSVGMVRKNMETSVLWLQHAVHH